MRSTGTAWYKLGARADKKLHKITPPFSPLSGGSQAFPGFNVNSQQAYLEDIERDSEEEEDEDEDEEEDPYAQQLKDAKEAIRGKKGMFPTRDEQTVFIEHHGLLARQPHENHGTLLHAIADMVKDKEIKPQAVQPLVKRLVEDCPDLIRTKNEHEQTSLYTAILFKEAILVECMLSACPDQQCLKDALEAPCKREADKNCLHLALEKDLVARVTQKLIRAASEAALAARDSRGKTPFHYAVKYDQCSEKRIGTIKLLIERDMEIIAGQRISNPSRPIESSLDYVDKLERSVYREHLETARVYRKSVEAASLASEQKKLATAYNNQVGGDENPSSFTRLEMKQEPRQRELKHQSKLERLKDFERAKPDDDRQKLRQHLKMQEKQAREREQPERKPSYQELILLQKNTIDTRPNDAGLRVDPSPNTPIKRVPTAQFEVLEPKEKTKEEKDEPKVKKPLSERKKFRTRDAHTLANNSEKILRKLKLHYMRTRNIERATSFLYGKNANDVQIYFDYEGLPLEMTDHIFKTSFGHNKKTGIRFDEVLKFVKFTNVTVNHVGRLAEKGKTGALGRRDMEFFFDWLYNKGVRRILHLVVEDDAKVVHSDESIQKSLEKMIVEHLDWRKTDMDPETICSIGKLTEKKCPTKEELNKIVISPKSRLKEVTLRWSGNNAILRAWSEPEGLPLLTKLRTINLHTPAATDIYDTTEWIREKVEKFQERIDKNARARATACKTKPGSPSTSPATMEQKPIVNSSPKGLTGIEVKVHDETGKAHKVASNHTPGKLATTKIATSHKWLECMDEFAGHISPFWVKTRDEFRKSLGESQVKDVKEAESAVEKDVIVALIDDGVDSCDRTFEGCILEGKTFDYQDGRVGQCYVSAKGHGTEMARMILRVCPMAKIYPIRLKTNTSPDGKTQIVLRSAAMAIEAALEKNATIISMSWTVPIPKEKTEEYALFRRVLGTACERKIPMFCSSPDGGQFTDKDYPTAYDSTGFFRIGAAHDDGSAYSYAGHITRLDFIFPGVNISMRPDGPVDNTTSAAINATAANKQVTGSSIATALAAGLAATIIHCFKASCLAVQTASALKDADYKPGPGIVIKPEQVKQIAQRDILKVAFGKIGVLTEGRFIQVWESFERANNVFKNTEKDYEDHVACIMNLCSNLIELG